MLTVLTLKGQESIRELDKQIRLQHTARTALRELWGAVFTVLPRDYPCQLHFDPLGPYCFLQMTGMWRAHFLTAFSEWMYNVSGVTKRSQAGGHLRDSWE